MQYGLQNAGKAYILYNASADALNLDLTKVKGSFKARILNAKNNSVLKEMKVNAGSVLKIEKVGNADEVIILNKI